MENLNQIVAKNLIELRKKSNLTQHEFAEKLSYSNKTISKWELGYAIPNVETLKEIADYYNIPVDYLLTEHIDITDRIREKTTGYRLALMLLVDVFFILIAVICYVAVITFTGNNIWPAFLYAGALSFFFNAFVAEKWWYKTWLPYIFASLCIWTILLSIYFTLITFNISYNFWYLFFVGLPIQVAVVIILILKHTNKRFL